MRSLARLGLGVLAAAFALLCLFEILRFSSELGVSPLHYVLEDIAIGLAGAAGSIACVVKLRRLMSGPVDGSPLPVPAGPLLVPVQKAGIVIFVGAAVFIMWLGTGAVLAKHHIPHAFLISLAVLLAIAAGLFRRILTAPYYLRIDQSGLHHYRLGEVPWTDVGGIRINSLSVKGSVKYILVVLVKRPAHYAERLDAWYQYFYRRALRDKGLLQFPLQVTGANPAHVFEAATRFRAKASPAALTGWDGDRRPVAPLLRWLQDHPLTAGAGPEALELWQRVASTVAASLGGWSHLDTPEMAVKRAEMNALSQAKRDLVQSRQNQAMSARPPIDVESGTMALKAAAQTAETEFGESADGRRLAELELQLRSQVATSARRERWQIALVLIALLAFYIGMQWLRR